MQQPGKVVVDENGIKDMWKKCMGSFINVENEWDHVVSSSGKEGPADCIMILEDTAALKKMKKHKNSRLVAEMIPATQDTGIQWLTVHKGGMYSRGLEIECGITNLQG